MVFSTYMPLFNIIWRRHGLSVKYEVPAMTNGSCYSTRSHNFNPVWFPVWLASASLTDRCNWCTDRKRKQLLPMVFWIVIQTEIRRWLSLNVENWAKWTSRLKRYCLGASFSQQNQTGVCSAIRHNRYFIVKGTLHIKGSPFATDNEET